MTPQVVRIPTAKPSLTPLKILSCDHLFSHLTPCGLVGKVAVKVAGSGLSRFDLELYLVFAGQVEYHLHL